MAQTRRNEICGFAPLFIVLFNVAVEFSDPDFQKDNVKIV